MPDNPIRPIHHMSILLTDAQLGWVKGRAAEEDRSAGYIVRELVENARAQEAA